MNKLILAIIIATVALSFTLSVKAEVIPYGSLTYTAPSERIDNTKMTIDEIAGYLVYRNGIEVPSGTFDVYPISNTSTGFDIPLLTGKNDFNIVTLDTEGRTSTFSSTVSLPWATAPKPVSNFTGQITLE